MYYILDSDNKRYKISIKVNKDLLPFVQSGEKLKVYYKEEKDVTEVIKVE